MNYLPRPALNCDPPDLCLPSRWDYRRESHSAQLHEPLLKGAEEDLEPSLLVCAVVKVRPTLVLD
jgi:hypothetical protein